jgi:ankyrin repeat protein/antitoxin (DNA-binding transcriptional repressor) of toxin-antitoxin stability system
VNLEQLRKQAKQLVRAARAGEPEAVARLGDLPVKLASAQLVLAREHGYSSWPALVHAWEASVESFVVAATDQRRERAERLLAARPEIGRDPWAALVLGHGWGGDPNGPGGPRGWSPLHYACHSCFDTLEVARELLRRGADPNAFYPNEYGPMSTLYGAAGMKHDAELTRALLEAGADPNAEPCFGDALYHSVESERTDCVALLLGHGARPSGTNALAHALDYEHALDHVRVLLEAGAEPNEHAHVAHAVRRGRGPEFIRLLASHGADLDAKGGETWRGDVPLRTPYAHAVLRNREEVAAMLGELGASTAVEPADLAVAAVARGERPATPLPNELDPDQQEVLILAVLVGGQVDLVVELLGVEFTGVVGGSPSGTLLHHAAWVGDAELVARLIELGADPAAASGAEWDSPLAWAVLDSHSWRAPGRDFVRVAELLVQAGAVVEQRFDEVAEGPLAEWLESRL